MTEEQIEKAAEQYAEPTRAYLLGEETNQIKKAFIDGAAYVLQNLWTNNGERLTKTENTLHFPSGSVEYLQISDGNHIGVNDEMVRLRIAAHAMQGILANQTMFDVVLKSGHETLEGEGIAYRSVAKASLIFADALIDECRNANPDE